ncbi:MAG: 4-alpha-glucanotransferase [Waltera sp.]
MIGNIIRRLVKNGGCSVLMVISYTMLCIDHFRGFDEYWFVPYGDPTAQNGHWEKDRAMNCLL